MARSGKLTEDERKENEKFRKRSKSLMRKAHGLATLTKAEVYVVLRRHQQYTVYKSKDDGWPPSEDNMSKAWPIPEYFGPNDFREDMKSHDTPRSLSAVEEDTKPFLETGDEVKRIITIPLPPPLPETPMQATFEAPNHTTYQYAPSEVGIYVGDLSAVG